MLQRIVLIFIVFWSFTSVAQNSEAQAESYYKKGEFDKALIIYQNLLKEKPYNYNYIYKLVDIHQQLEQYNDAQTILEDRLGKNQESCYGNCLGLQLSA